MINDSFPVVCICCLFFLGAMSFVASIEIFKEKYWTYYPISIETYSSDPELIALDFQVDRISRNVFSLSGKWKQNFDVTYDATMNVRVFRSVSGTSEYIEISYGVSKRGFYEYMNNFYKEWFMKDIANCSNFIQFENELVPPIEKKVYEMNKCQITNERLPQYVPAGFYKFVANGSGGPDGPEASAVILVKVESKF